MNNFPNERGVDNHYIESLVRHWVPVASGLVVLLKKKEGKWVVYDGSHRLLALLLVKKHRPELLKINRVGGFVVL